MRARLLPLVLLAGGCEQDTEGPPLSDRRQQVSIAEPQPETATVSQPRPPEPARKADAIELTFVGDIIFGR